MKTFKDLEFKQHINIGCGFDTQANLTLNNNYGISVVTGSAAYCSSDTYEVAIIKDGSICYDTDLTDDVLGHQTPKEIDNIIIALSKFN